jgi:hypothetical protein
MAERHRDAGVTWWTYFAAEKEQHVNRMGGEAVAGSIDVLNPDRPKRILIVASNPAVSKQTGWPIGFWWAEVTHPYWELTERGYRVDIASPDGGPLQGTNGATRATRASIPRSTSSALASSIHPIIES